ncbi:glycosyltransferase family 4 protein [Peribacillus butanolivorans]|uniref:glycosyltransferase family 4 protein n=1 Tax=Peribacillus butanolivorans TaxID=421767 RepID=UPI0036DC1FD6
MKILYVTTISNTVNAFFIPHIRLLINQGYQVDVAFNIVQEVNSEIIKMGCKVHKLEFERSPLKKQNYLAYKKLKKLIQDEQYDLIHTHTPVASACVRLVCKEFDDVKVIYTAHGFHFYKGAPLINWLLYYPIERLLARYTEVLITINKEDYERAKKSFNANNIKYIPGVGIDIKGFEQINVNKLVKRQEIGLSKDSFVLLSVGELNKNKNHEAVIKAIAKINNPNVYYIICGNGILMDYLRNLIKELGLERQIKILGFRKDIAEICKVSDIFVFPSYREGLSVALMEAMATGLPVVCSNIRGNSDLIEDGKGGYLVRPDDVDGISNAINTLAANKDLRKAMSLINLETIKKFDTENVKKELKKVYEDL